MYKKIFNKKTLGLLLLLAVVFIWGMPTDGWFTKPYSPVVFGTNGELLSASVAQDGQWRFFSSAPVTGKFKDCLLTFEDQYFSFHPGVNPLALFRASLQNLRTGKIVSGASTITMQVVRLHRQQPRTFAEKIVEILWALRLEVSLSKANILRTYASHAPFGGNIVGLEAASWRYFGRKPENLSWGEAALLAVLPNQPGLLFPGKNQSSLLTKRNRLLEKLVQKGVLDSLEAALAKDEPIPAAPLPVPREAYHLLQHLQTHFPAGKNIENTNIQEELQRQINRILTSQQVALAANQVHNAAVLVLEVATGKVLSYVGNMPQVTGQHGQDVDVIQARRSTGSILKPFLYAAMLQEGQILPRTLVRDVPIYFQDFTPQNFFKTYDGVVHADDALARSLNVPAVMQLSDYGVGKFHALLIDLGFESVDRTPENYGLSLILGGAEATLWDLCKVYAGLARTLNNYYLYRETPRYNPADLHRIHLFPEGKRQVEKRGTPVLNAAAIWLTFEALAKVNRPTEDASWQLYASSRKLAWKTGTSFGHRDAWAIGISPQYVVGVWVGNANGEGRPGLTGLSAAAPIMFQVADLLPATNWFTPPHDELEAIPTCRQSGYRASGFCTATDTLLVPQAGLRTLACTYHKKVHLDATRQFRASADCLPPNQLVAENWFVLPPVEAWYYSSKNAAYRPLPPFLPGCQPSTGQSDHSMEILYPVANARIFLPVELDSQLGEIVFEVAHKKTESVLFWHIDDTFIATTQHIHKLNVQPAAGKHQLTVVDENGETVHCDFEIVRKTGN